MKKVFEDYYLGLDIGTDSIGWAVTNSKYEIQRFNKNAMWGVRLFDEALTAAERRVFRSSRRRLIRKKNRISLLQEIFSKEISKVDGAFFQRLNDSRLYPEDKQENQIYSLFTDPSYTDKNYYEEYPTIFHLRKELLTNKEPHDLRLVYLAISHIMKNRGHFLFDGDLSSATDFSSIFNNFLEVMEAELECELSPSSIEEIETLLKDKTKNRTNKKSELQKLLNVTSADKQKTAIISLIAGLSGDLTRLFPHDSTVTELERTSLKFSDYSYEDHRLELEDMAPELCFVVDTIKTLYDWSILADILSGGESSEGTFLSVAKVKLYDSHKEDLKLLKKVIEENMPDEYENVLSSPKEKDNYASYIGHTMVNKKKHSLKRANRDDFYKYLKKKLKALDENNKDVKKILQGMEDNNFLKLPISKDNSVIPNQVHKAELIKILDNAEKFLPFLKEKTSDNITNRQKIEDIFSFKIPYYVGPLNTSHEKEGANVWMRRKEDGPIRPWNFEEKVDLDVSANNFMSRLTNKCTYLIGEDVLPKNSLLYSEYMVLNELNNLQIKAEPITNELKLKIYNDLFKKKARVTGKALLTYLQSEGYGIEKEDLSGFDQDFKASLTSYLDFKNKVFKDDLGKIDEHTTREMVEDLIRWILVYGENKEMLTKVIKKNYSDKLTAQQIKTVSNLRYTGWGRFSKKLLEEVSGVEIDTGEVHNSIIGALRDTTNNFMELLSNRFTFSDNISAINEDKEGKLTKITYNTITDDLYVSPSIKRAIWQVISITEELKKITGKPPKKIFIEMARGDKKALKGDAGRTSSRKTQFLELYKSIKDESRDWKAELENTNDDKFKAKKLYLYYTQMGKCMYTGEHINLNQLADANLYDIDHIYPRSKTKDDSWDNLVLTKKEVNLHKSNEIIDFDTRNKMTPFWKMLLNNKMITKEKYKRLTRSTPLTDEELAGFINRQLVETRQSTKAVAEVFKKLYPDSNIVYIKSEAVTSFRNENDFVKVRSINDYHHAKDAYLNIVVGNVYHTKFTSNPLRWLKGNKDKNFNLARMFDFDCPKDDGSVWKRGKTGTIETVNKTMAKNNILYTRHSTETQGGYFDQQPVSKKDNPGVSLKKGLNPEKYGGYKGVTPAYFALVESDDKKKRKLTIEPVPLYLKNEFEKDPNKYIEYCENVYNLKNPIIKLPKIKKNTLFIIDGFLMHLRGHTGTQLQLQSAVQLVISQDLYGYYKKIENFLNKKSDSKNSENEFVIREDYDKITSEMNLKLYDELTKKHSENIFLKRPANQSSLLQNGKDLFIAMSLEEQCIALNEMLNLFKCRPVTADLTSLKGSKNAGNMALTKNLVNNEEVLIRYQSNTGLFSKEIDLLKL